MEYTKGESGKWDIHELDNSFEIHPLEDSEEGIIIIADVIWESVSKEEAFANARLIASAPDLYEALKGLLNWAKLSDSGDTGVWSDENDPAIIQANQAITKAEGG